MIKSLHIRRRYGLMIEFCPDPDGTVPAPEHSEIAFPSADWWNITLLLVLRDLLHLLTGRDPG